MLDGNEAKNIAQKRSQLKREAEQRRFRKVTLDQIGKEISEGKVKELNIIINAVIHRSVPEIYFINNETAVTSAIKNIVI